MTKLMDDPTTYLAKDVEDVVIMLARNIESARNVAKQYGVSIQLNMPGGLGIRVVSTVADALNVAALYPANTPWCVVHDDGWDFKALAVLTNRFGPNKTIAQALNVQNEGIAWRPDKYPVDL